MLTYVPRTGPSLQDGTVKKKKNEPLQQAEEDTSACVYNREHRRAYSVCVGACEKHLPPPLREQQEARDNTEASCRVQLQTASEPGGPPAD